MKRIEEQARMVYFNTPRKSPSRLGIFEEGYVKGYHAALNEFRNALDKPNNKEKIESINELIKEYDIC